MITGTVTSHEAVIALTVRGPTGRERNVQAVVDTGFSHFLTLPPLLTAELELSRRRTARIVLADGSTRTTNVYGATVVWDGRPRRLLVEEADTTPLVGMELLSGYALRVACVEDGDVEIEPLST